VDDIPAPPSRSDEELQDMTTKEKLLEAKSCWKGPCTKKDLLAFCRRHYHGITQKEMDSLLVGLTNQNKLIGYQDGNSYFYILPEESETKEQIKEPSSDTSVDDY